MGLMGDKKNPHAVALAKLGAAKGGRARAKKLSPERRREIARKAAETRWKKKAARESGE
jgi:hypothetical protein